MDQQGKIKTVKSEITLGGFFEKIRSGFRYARTKWLVILTLSLLGGLAGLAYSIFKKTIYTAVSTFVLEDGSKTGSLGQYASLASLAGIDVNSGSGLFQGDNILELYKSRSMIEKTLLSQAVFNNKQQLLIDRYVDFNDLRERWRKKDNIQSIGFAGDPDKFNRTQDSIISDIVEKFNKKVLSVNKLDKKLSIIVVQVSCTDELFAKEFTKRLVETVNDFYVQTKTKKSAQNAAVLQHQADSVKSILNASINGVATAMDNDPNPNPQLVSLKVASQKRQVDVQASSAVYGEIVKNLEIARIALRQDIPLIQIIDQPVFPLKNDKVGKVKGIVLGVVLTCFISVFVFVFKGLRNL